jgi:hypothetical protein
MNLCQSEEELQRLSAEELRNRISVLDRGLSLAYGKNWESKMVAANTIVEIDGLEALDCLSHTELVKQVVIRQQAFSGYMDGPS